MNNSKQVLRRDILRVAGAATLMFAAGPVHGQQVYKAHNALRPGEYIWHPERRPNGPISIIISNDEQHVHVYRNGFEIAVSTCSTGMSAKAIPTGVFVVQQKNRTHRSSTYESVPVQNADLLHWSGIALHADNVADNHSADGCVSLPLEFSVRLFDEIHLGSPIIIAPTHIHPLEIEHPGMILADYTEQQFAGVVETLGARKPPSEWTLSESYPIISLIVSSYDRKIMVIENDIPVAEGPLHWDGAPLGQHVYVLRGANKEAKSMQWQALSYGVDGQDSVHDLRRVKAEASMSDTILRYAHPGMVLVFTDKPLRPESRSSRDFVIMSSVS
ncbi:L,D-transpeptidase family protein [Puniceibacterium sp. IMCC21224]|uniref:L,D-transpeptidase family protein n=1 Tax=Puniceibacterium sp. IMCC21224 TaxID=1618204 RepID=UPI00065D3857|nr:L,D-transpeptidase family protein [Puniceibacterium sp. IMCC21224]KMK67986.1 Ykud domain-containing protein [Puniceibacterium sp. IMCC21224]